MTCRFLLAQVAAWFGGGTSWFVAWEHSSHRSIRSGIGWSSGDPVQPPVRQVRKKWSWSILGCAPWIGPWPPRTLTEHVLTYISWDLVTNNSYSHKLHSVVHPLDQIATAWSKMCKSATCNETNGSRMCKREVRGKQSYQAPEMHGSDTYDAFLADDFALGVVVFAMAVQDYPWTATKKGHLGTAQNWHRKTWPVAGLRKVMTFGRTRYIPW